MRRNVRDIAMGIIKWKTGFVLASEVVGVHVTKGQDDGVGETKTVTFIYIKNREEAFTGRPGDHANRIRDYLRSNDRIRSLDLDD